MLIPIAAVSFTFNTLLVNSYENDHCKDNDDIWQSQDDKNVYSFLKLKKYNEMLLISISTELRRNIIED